MDVSLLELRIRSLPGVVACQMTPTSVMILVGPDGDGAAVNAAVIAMLDQAASDLAVKVLAVPAPATPVPLWRRGRAGLALAGSAAALSATVAAAATLGVLTAPDPSAPPAPPAASSPSTEPAPASPKTRHSKNASDDPAGDVRTIELVAAVDPPAAPPAEQTSASERRVEQAAAAAPVLLEIPLPAEVAAAIVPAAAPPPRPALTTASASNDDDDHRPQGRARRVRAGIDDRDGDQPVVPAAAASPVATAEGARHDDLDEPPGRSGERGEHAAEKLRKVGRGL